MSWNRSTTLWTESTTPVHESTMRFIKWQPSNLRWRTEIKSCEGVRDLLIVATDPKTNNARRSIGTRWRCCSARDDARGARQSSSARGLRCMRNRGKMKRNLWRTHLGGRKSEESGGSSRRHRLLSPWGNRQRWHSLVTLRQRWRAERGWHGMAKLLS
jgi:hypothetical protein